MGRTYKRGKIWWVEYRDENGVGQRKSTKQNDKDVASQLLAARETEMLLHQRV